MSSPDAFTHPSRRARHRAATLVVAAALTAATTLGGLALAAPATAADSATFTGIVLGVGASENQRIVSWYTSADTTQSVQLAPSASVVNGQFPAGAQTFSAQGAANIATSGGYNRHAVVTDLEQNTQYSYRVGSEGNWSTVYSFKTQSFDGPFDFLFFGDPQIGSSGNTAKDQAGWVDTMNVAVGANPDAELLVSGGDQVETANTESQWDAFLAPDQLRQIPWAATIGNHDVGGKAYEQHFYTPNTDRSGAYYRNGNANGTDSGGDYWYIYKDVLFIDLNSNSYATSQGGGGDAAHVQYVTDVINAHGAEAKYKVLVYHHSIYSPADHAQDADNVIRRTDFPTVFSNLGVDLVLQGHDHSYSRSYSILNGAKANPDEKAAAPEVFTGPGGVIYVTANSASGSKYYDLTDPAAGSYGADPTDTSAGHKRHFANSVEDQEHVRTYVQVGVTDSKLNVQTVRAGDCTTGLNPAVQRGKVSTCGQTLAPLTVDPSTQVVSGGDAAPVGSLVDHFSLYSSLPATTVDLTASASSIEIGSGASVTLTATVGGGLNGQSGSVTFFDGTTAIGSTPLAGGAATITIPSSLAVGAHALTAQFTTASKFTGADTTSAATTFTVTAPVVTTPPTTTPPATKAPSKTTIKWSKNKVTVTVKSAGHSVSGTAKVYDGSKKVKTVAIKKGKGTSTLKLKKGTHKLKATFVGTKTIGASTSSKIVLRVR